MTQYFKHTIKNYNSFYLLLENAFNNEKTHYTSRKNHGEIMISTPFRNDLRTLQNKWNRSADPTN